VGDPIFKLFEKSHPVTSLIETSNSTIHPCVFHDPRQELKSPCTMRRPSSVFILGLWFLVFLLISTPSEAKLKGASVVDDNNYRRRTFGNETSPPVVGKAKSSKKSKKKKKKSKESTTPPSNGGATGNPTKAKRVINWLLEPFGGVGGVFDWGLRVVFGEP
jgi:hypothetical protein